MRWTDRATVERVRSEVPTSGRTATERWAPGPDGEGGADAQDRARREELGRFVQEYYPGPAG